MNELVIFYEKLSGCDMIALTPINERRFYCRFYSNGIYLDRMFVTDIRLQEELILHSGDDEMIDKDNVLRLKNKYANLSKAAGTEGTLETASDDGV
ncbi:hypothetical protein [Pontibacter brevis]